MPNLDCGFRRTAGLAETCFAPMHVERLDIDGFRNICESVKFDPALTLLLGENNAGKTNVIDA